MLRLSLLALVCGVCVADAYGRVATGTHRHVRRRHMAVRVHAKSFDAEGCEETSQEAMGDFHLCRPSVSALASLHPREKPPEDMPRFYMHMSGTFDFTKKLTCFWSFAKKNPSAANLASLRKATSDLLLLKRMSTHPKRTKNWLEADLHVLGSPFSLAYGIAGGGNGTVDDQEANGPFNCGSLAEYYNHTSEIAKEVASWPFYENDKARKVLLVGSGDEPIKQLLGEKLHGVLSAGPATLVTTGSGPASQSDFWGLRKLLVPPQMSASFEKEAANAASAGRPEQFTYLPSADRAAQNLNEDFCRDLSKQLGERSTTNTKFECSLQPTAQGQGFEFEYLNSTFCIVPTGTFASPSQLFASLTAGCVPIVMGDYEHVQAMLPFKASIDWSKAAIFAGSPECHASPHSNEVGLGLFRSSGENTTSDWLVSLTQQHEEGDAARCLSSYGRSMAAEMLSYRGNGIIDGVLRETSASALAADECAHYKVNNNCDWTEQYACPVTGLRGTLGVANDDDSPGYRCCCDNYAGMPPEVVAVRKTITTEPPSNGSLLNVTAETAVNASSIASGLENATGIASSPEDASSIASNGTIPVVFDLDAPDVNNATDAGVLMAIDQEATAEAHATVASKEEPDVQPTSATGSTVATLVVPVAVPFSEASIPQAVDKKMAATKRLRELREQFGQLGHAKEAAGEVSAQPDGPSMTQRLRELREQFGQLGQAKETTSEAEVQPAAPIMTQTTPSAQGHLVSNVSASIADRVAERMKATERLRGMRESVQRLETEKAAKLVAQIPDEQALPTLQELEKSRQDAEQAHNEAEIRLEHMRSKADELMSKVEALQAKMSPTDAALMPGVDEPAPQSEAAKELAQAEKERDEALVMRAEARRAKHEAGLKLEKVLENLVQKRSQAKPAEAKQKLEKAADDTAVTTPEHATSLLSVSVDKEKQELLAREAALARREKELASASEEAERSFQRKNEDAAASAKKLLLKAQAEAETMRKIIVPAKVAEANEKEEKLKKREEMLLQREAATEKALAAAEEIASRAAQAAVDAQRVRDEEAAARRKAEAQAADEFKARKAEAEALKIAKRTAEAMRLQVNEVAKERRRVLKERDDEIASRRAAESAASFLDVGSVGASASKSMTQLLAGFHAPSEARMNRLVESEPSKHMLSEQAQRNVSLKLEAVARLQQLKAKVKALEEQKAAKLAVKAAAARRTEDDFLRTGVLPTASRQQQQPEDALSQQQQKMTELAVEQQQGQQQLRQVALVGENATVQNATALPQPSTAAPVEKRCDTWCISHTAGWATKCGYKECSACDGCSGHFDGIDNSWLQQAQQRAKDALAKMREAEAARDKAHAEQDARISAAERAAVMAADNAKRELANKLDEAEHMKQRVLAEARASVSASDNALESANHTAQLLLDEEIKAKSAFDKARAEAAARREAEERARREAAEMQQMEKERAEAEAAVQQLQREAAAKVAAAKEARDKMMAEAAAKLEAERSAAAEAERLRSEAARKVESAKLEAERVERQERLRLEQVEQAALAAKNEAELHKARLVAQHQKRMSGYAASTNSSLVTGPPAPAHPQTQPQPQPPPPLQQPQPQPPSHPHARSKKVEMWSPAEAQNFTAGVTALRAEWARERDRAHRVLDVQRDLKARLMSR